MQATNGHVGCQRTRSRLMAATEYFSQRRSDVGLDMSLLIGNVTGVGDRFGDPVAKHTEIQGTSIERVRR